MTDMTNPLSLETKGGYTPAVTAAARALCKNASDICGVDNNDNWKIYGDQFLNEAQIALNAAGFTGLLEAASCGHADSPGLPAGDLLAAANVLRNNGNTELAERIEAKHELEFAAIARATGA